MFAVFYNKYMKTVEENPGQVESWCGSAPLESDPCDDVIITGRPLW